MKMRFFDFEVLPHWWLCVLGDLPDDISKVDTNIRNDFTVITSDDFNARDKLMSLFKESDVCITGYNIKGYDLAIANAIYQGFTPEQIKIVNDIIINPGCAWDTREHIRMQPFAKKKLTGVCFQDLFDDSTGTLKEKEATLGLNILESSVDFNKEDLTKDDKDDLIYYCKQDVYASMIFYIKVVLPYTKVKLAMGKHFNIPEDVCHKSTNARLVSLALGAKRQTYADADLVEIQLPSKIRDYCYENLPSKLVDKIRCDTKNFETHLFNNLVSFGNGGVHSTYSPDGQCTPCLYLESDDDYVLLNVDATSYYPSLMIQLNLLSRSVSIPKVFSDIFDERVMIKHKPNKTEEDELAQMADKLVLNTTFGASGNKWLDLYDPHMCTSVCRVGQIFLAALANKIFKTVKNSIIVQTNTDGILCYIPRQEMDTLKKCTDEWTRISGINMEQDDITKIWQRDVNNYLLVKTNGKVKRKGGWLNDTWMRPGYVTVGTMSAFVCAKAAIKYLVEGKDIIQEIVNNKNIFDYVITCTKGPTYRGVVQRFSDGKEVPLYKANRVIAVKDDYYGKLYKVKMYKGNISYTQMPSTPEHCYTVNDDLNNYNFDELKSKIDYMYYIQRTVDLLDINWYSIKNNQLYENHNFDLDY